MWVYALVFSLMFILVLVKMSFNFLERMEKIKHGCNENENKEKDDIIDYTNGRVQ